MESISVPSCWYLKVGTVLFIARRRGTWVRSGSQVCRLKCLSPVKLTPVFIVLFLVSGDNMMGFTHREARLAGRVREMEEQNYLLRHQLSLSQGQLMQVMRQTVTNHTTDPPVLYKCTKVLFHYHSSSFLCETSMKYAHKTGEKLRSKCGRR